MNNENKVSILCILSVVNFQYITYLRNPDYCHNLDIVVDGQKGMDSFNARLITSPYDYIFIDVHLSAEDKETNIFLDGIGIGEYIRKRDRDCKIFLFPFNQETMQNNKSRLEDSHLTALSSDFVLKDYGYIFR